MKNQKDLMILMYLNTISFYIKTSGKTSVCQLMQKLCLKKVFSDSLGNLKKKKKVQILTLVMQSHKFCAFTAVS